MWSGILLLALSWRLLGITQTEVWRDEAITIIHTHDRWLDLLTRLPWVEDTPPWFKDQTVYRLESTLSADQLLDEYDAYQGKPPRHRLEPSTGY